MSWKHILDEKVREESLHKIILKKKVRREFSTAAINKANGAGHKGTTKTGREVKR